MLCEGPNCTREVEQASGGHRQRRFCSDRCRMAASRWRADQAELERDRQRKEASIARECAELRQVYPMITDESIDLLRHLRQVVSPTLAASVAAALVREHQEAKSNLARMKQERRIVEHQALSIGRYLGFPAVPELDLEPGEATWWVWIIDDRNNLDQLFAALNVTGKARSSGQPVTIDE